MKYESNFKKYINFVKVQGEEGKAHCPFHEDDKHPSLSANLETGLWQCFGCGSKGNFIQFEKRITTGKRDVHDTLDEMPVQTVNNFHEALLSNEFIYSYAKVNRLWTEDIIKKYKIGWNGYRVTIPITDEDGTYVNIRCYDMLHRFSPSEKMISWRKSSGSIKIWPPNHLESSKLYLFEGEPDALAGLSLGLPAISFTAGADSASKNIYKFSKYLKDKDIYLIYDMDDAGRIAANNISNTLSKIAKVYNVQLPVKDFTDYIKDHNIKDFDKLVKGVRLFEKSDGTVKILSEPINVDLSRAGYPEYYLKHISLKAIVSGKDLIPYLIPEKIKITCNVNNSFCKSCPMAIYNGKSDHTIEKLNPIILELVGASTKGMSLILKEYFFVPKRCSSFEIEIIKAQNVEELRLIPEFVFTDFDSLEEYVVRQAYFTGAGIKSNATYSFTGTTLPHPKNQYVTHIFNESKTVEDLIINFKLDDDKIKLLKLFKPNSKDITKKIKEILDDLAYNITKIYQRNDLLESILFTYLSVISFNFLDKPIKKGWVESLIIGDTRCGKTETIEKLITHFKLGEIATGENVSYAGLVGGIQSVSNKFMISWGKIPLNDRKLLVIDEASSLDIEAIEKLSGIRSSGIAEITKIQAEKTFARTRLIWISNPRSDRLIRSYDLGILTVNELIGKPEDVARFDFALILSTDEVDKEMVNKFKHKKIKHIYTSEAFNILILWIWSKTKNKILFGIDVERLILKRSLELGEKFNSNIALINPADFRLKLARISVAVAALMFSTDGGYDNLIVEKEHVDYACSFLERIYSKDVCSYDVYAERRKKELIIRDADKVTAQLTIHGKDFVECLSDAQYLRMSDFEDFGGMERSTAKELVSYLVKRRAIMRRHSFYAKTPPFIDLLKKILNDKDTVYGLQENLEV